MPKKEQILILFCYSSIVGNFNYNPEVLEMECQDRIYAYLM